MTTERDRHMARERAAAIRQDARRPQGQDGGRQDAATYGPAVAAESAGAMRKLMEPYGISVDDLGRWGLTPDKEITGQMDAETDFPSPGGYIMRFYGHVPEKVREAVREACEACSRDKDRGLLPDWLREGLPELAENGYVRFGLLPGDFTYLVRTPGGMIVASVVEADRADALHSFKWDVPMRSRTPMLIAYVPDGTPWEMRALTLFIGEGARVSQDDARDARCIPGADAMGLVELSGRLLDLSDQAGRMEAALYAELNRELDGHRDSGLDQKTLRTAAAVKLRDREYARRRERARARREAADRPVRSGPVRQTFASVIRDGVRKDCAAKAGDFRFT